MARRFTRRDLEKCIRRKTLNPFILEEMHRGAINLPSNHPLHGLPPLEKCAEESVYEFLNERAIGLGRYIHDNFSREQALLSAVTIAEFILPIWHNRYDGAEECLAEYVIDKAYEAINTGTGIGLSSENYDEVRPVVNDNRLWDFVDSVFYNMISLLDDEPLEDKEIGDRNNLSNMTMHAWNAYFEYLGVTACHSTYSAYESLLSRKIVSKLNCVGADLSGLDWFLSPYGYARDKFEFVNSEDYSQFYPYDLSFDSLDGFDDEHFCRLSLSFEDVCVRVGQLRPYFRRDGGMSELSSLDIDLFLAPYYNQDLDGPCDILLRKVNPEELSECTRGEFVDLMNQMRVEYQDHIISAV